MALRIIAFVGLLWTGSWCSALAAENVAVAVFAPDPASARYEKTVQARLEEILRDAGLVVLDEEKAKKMKREWVNLADASHVVTAEEFVANAGKYDIARVYSISFTAGASSAMSLFYTASAATQLRVIDKQARVGAFSSAPMGIRGFPPSDALTSDAALVNALQRAVDSVAEAAGVSPAAPVTAKYIPLKLEASAAPANYAEAGAPAASPAGAWTGAAKLLKETFAGEDITCEAGSPDGQIGVVGGYTWQKLRLGGMGRLVGGRLHLIDIKAGREFTLFTMHELGKRGAGEDGISAPLACGFLGNWRYLIGVTGNKLSCFDVERGLETCTYALPEPIKKASMSVVTADGKRYLRLDTDRGLRFFSIATGR